MYSALRPHLGAITALLFSAILATAIVGCQVHTSSIEKPGQTVTLDTLNQEVARAQQRLDKEAADVSAAVAKYNADAQATQSEIDASTAEAARRVNERKAIIGAIPAAAMSIVGQVSSGHIDPVSLAGSLVASVLPVLGVGATVDSVRSRLKLSQVTKPWDGVVDRRGADAAAAPPTKLAA